MTNSYNSNFSLTKGSPLVNNLSPGLLHCLLADLSDYSLTPIQALLCCQVRQTLFSILPPTKYIYIYLQIENALLNQNLGIF